MPKSFTIEIPGKPLSLNRVSSGSHWQKSDEIKKWREAGKLIAKPYAGKLKLPVDLRFTVLYSGRLSDHESPTWAFKALKDSLTDAGIYADDAPKKYVHDLTIAEPIKAKYDAIVLTVTEAR